MITYSFYQLYYGSQVCCKSKAEKERHAKSLQINRAVAWASLGIALAGASYGRVPLPKLASFKGGGPTGTMAGLRVTSKQAAILNFQVEGMHCGGCANKIQKAIESIKGVQQVVVDYKSGAVIVKGGNEQAIMGAISTLGYIIAGM